MKKTVKRLLALILTIMMVLSLNGFSVLADAAAESAAESVVGSAEEDAEALAKQAEEEAACFQKNHPDWTVQIKEISFDKK